MKDSIKKNLALIITTILVCSITSCGVLEGESDNISDSTSSSVNIEEDSESINDSESESGDTDMANGNANIEKFKQDGYSALFADNYFSNGIRVKSVDGNNYSDIPLTVSTGNPSWTLAQWASKYELTLNDYYEREYTNAGKAMTISSKGRSIGGNYVPAKVLAFNGENASIYLELNTEVEYDSPRKEGEGWPHILLSQDFGNNLINVSSLSELIMNMDFTITKLEDKMNGEANSALHCSQFVWYITLQNRNKASVGYGQYIWFGVNLWDNRMQGKVSSEYAAQDLGKADATLAFIYQPSSVKFYQSGKQPLVGEKAKVNFELLETAKYAFNLAKSRGYLPDTSWEEIFVGGMNFGFENTGTYNSAVNIDSVGVYYK